MIVEYEKLYKELISSFLLRIPVDIPIGITCPMIPCVGDNYEKAKIRIAFFGMETNGWWDLKKFKGKYKNNIDGAFNNLTDNFKKLSFVDWTNNFHTSFWDYVLTFLSRFYQLENVDSLINNEDYQNILRSFIWGNTNAIERHEITAGKHNVDKEIWDLIKKESRVFDTAKYILETCKPHVLIINNWSEDESWLLGKHENINRVEIDDRLYYYYLPETETHVYWLPHPTWLSRKKIFKSSIEKIINDLSVKNIRGDAENIFEADENDKIHKANIDKKEYIGRLALFLESMNTVMSGFELANHLNRNGYKTSYGTKYIGTRGTFKLIRDTYSHFSKRNKKDIAKAIAKSFVKENGEYAYE